MSQTESVAAATKPARSPAAAPDRSSPQLATRLDLLRSFELRLGDRRVELPLSAQRVIAFLALHDRPLQRPFIAGSLWIDSSEEHAYASLRTALWRLRRPGLALVIASGSRLALAETVRVDVRDVAETSAVVLAGSSDDLGRDLYTLAARGELLPDWYDDWVVVERERVRQLRLHALEALCDELTAQKRYAEAAAAGAAAVAGEPLRESAHRALIRTHLAEGNAIEALRQYRIIESMLRDQLGLAPSTQLVALMQPLSIQ